MKVSSFHILRVGIAITFLWIGLLILKNPVGWTAYISGWVDDLLPIDPVQTMIATGILDIVVGAWLLTGVKTWIPSALGLFHLTTVLIVAGIDAITVRDIGLWAACLALVFDSVPPALISRITSDK